MKNNVIGNDPYRIRFYILANLQKFTYSSLQYLCVSHMVHIVFPVLEMVSLHFTN